jgi:acetoin utilization deacetylase AcuC-like enzyme
MTAAGTESAVGMYWSDEFLEPGEPRDELVEVWSAERVKIVHQALEAAQLPLRLMTAPPASEEIIALVHAPEYIRTIRDYSSGDRLRGDDYRIVNADTAITSVTYRHAAIGVGLTCAAVDAVLDGTLKRAVVRNRSGDHHAYPARGEGFCLFNYTAVAARYAQRCRGLERILIIDWDVHHGNGTQATFYSDGSVYYFSIHGADGMYPRTGFETERGAGPGQGATMNIPLRARTRDQEYIHEFARGLREIRFDPELILLTSGFDSHEHDPVGNLALSDRAYPIVTRMLRDFAEERCGGRLISTLGGGYNPDTLGRLTVLHVAEFSRD